jgi:virginiamycin B lyase
VRFDPSTERFEKFAFPRESANVRQILGRPGEIWLPESGTEHITVIRTR